MLHRKIAWSIDPIWMPMEYSDVDLGTWKPRNLLGVFLIDLTDGWCAPHLYTVSSPP